MTASPFRITSFIDSAHRPQAIALWEAVFGYDAPHNAPALAIDQKVAVDDGLFFVALADGAVVGTIMAGYDGHRGWLYSLAVTPERRHEGLGSALVQHAERALAARGCLKVNLQIVRGNSAVAAFYQTLGYRVEERISMGRLLKAPAAAGQG